MGLDVFVFRYLEIPDNIKTQDELDKFCNKHDVSWNFYSERYKNIPKKYVKKIPIELIDWDATFKKRGLNFGDYEESRSASGWWYEFIKKSLTPAEQENIEIKLSDILDDKEPDPNDTTIVRFNNDELVGKIEDVEVWVHGPEVGYQRKGANGQFYKDGKWSDNTIVSTKEMLLEDWDKYFSDPDDEYYGKGSRQAFKENIIDNFIEGETFVAYW